MLRRFRQSKRFSRQRVRGEHGLHDKGLLRTNHRGLSRSRAGIPYLVLSTGTDTEPDGHCTHLKQLRPAGVFGRHPDFLERSP